MNDGDNTTDNQSEHSSDEQRFREIEEKITSVEKENEELKQENERIRRQNEQIKTQLDQQQESNLPNVTRRQTLGLIGGGTLLGAAGSASAKASGNSGPPWAPDEHDHSGVYGTATHLGEGAPVESITTQSITAGNIQNGISNAQVQARWDGLVVPVASGLGVDDAIDPTTRRSPVQDAFDRLEDAGGGVVFLPPETVANEGTISQPISTGIVGTGFESEIIVTGNPDVLFDIGAADRGFCDRLRITGEGVKKTQATVFASSKRKGEPGDVANGAADYVGGQLWLQDAEGTALDLSPSFACRFDHIRIDVVDAGNVGALINLSSLETSIGDIHAYPRDGATGKDSRVVYAGGKGVNIGTLNIGGSAGRMLYANCPLWLGSWNYEPTGLNSTTESVIYFGRADDPAWTGMGTTTTGDFDYVYELDKGASNKILTPVKVQQKNGKPNKNIGVVTGELDPSSWYYGPKDDWDGGSENLQCLASAGTSPSGPPVDDDPEAPAYHVPNTSLTMDGNLDEVSNLAGLSIAEDFSIFRGQYTNGGMLWWTWDHDSLYLVADLNDDEHVQDRPASKMFWEDAIQASVSSGQPGAADTWDEFTIGLQPEGPTVFQAVLPQTSNPGVLESAAASIVRTSGHTRYEIGLPWDALTASPSDEFVSLAFAVHDSDSGGATGWVEWGSGILGGKNNAEFKLAELVTNDT